ncbi:ABC transporter substrate-binding protein [Rubrimonas sp.]|uniref:ABC transporter substrate-binding protein n=1 Tax=Rubrimonas sp. TaxID=2036015 RepID=UPI002FDCF0BE
MTACSSRMRRLLGTALVAVLGAVAAQAAGPALKEAPALAERVARGELPPIEKRLPQNPVVYTPLDRPGTHGGDWNHALVGGGSLSMVVRYQGYEPLVRFTPDWSGIEPNLAESWEVSPDSRVYTIRLREGVRWSDGEPFTTEDIRFWYDDVLLNSEVAAPVGQSYWQAGGEVGAFEVIDDYTFRVSFAEPNGFFLQQVAWANQDQMTRTPAHYLKQFHAAYNPEADALARQRGLDSWVALFRLESGLDDPNIHYQSSTRPGLTPWVFEIAPGQNTERAVAVRNPYYFKVDSEGAQLPYFDRVVYQLVADPEVLLLKVLQGEIDMMDQYIGTPTNRPVLYDGQERGGYRFYTLKETAANTMVFQLNLNHLDPVNNALFNDRDFREALSIAIDRQMLIDAVYVGQGEPAQASIIKGDPLYSERLALQHTEYDPARANEILDALLPERDSSGFRLDSQGRRVSIIFEIDQTRKTFLDKFELAIPMFQAVGIDAQMRTMDRSLWETRVRRGREFDATAHQFGANSGVAAMLDARYFVPFSSNSLYAPGWSLWFTDPGNPNAVEPPAEIVAIQDLYRKLLATGDENEQRRIMTELLEMAADQFLVFGVSMPPDGYGIVRNDMVNVAMEMPNSYGWPTPAPTRPETFFKSR